MTSNRDYETAVKGLNSLQTNASILDAIRKSGNLLNLKSMPEMQTFVNRMGYQVSDLDKLNVIHVAGTKGKGSTSALCESILRQLRVSEGQTSRPLKTGLYTSPHLLEVRERLRINGAPMSKELFAKYFFEVWDRLEATKPETIDEDHPDKPTYFRFLTLMAFHAFLAEKVDVVILEVGVGGTYDSTNVIEKPVVCGITSLGLDHVAVLGKTLSSIAWHKGGIMKPGVPVFVSQQEEEALTALRSRAEELKPSKYVEVKPSEYKVDGSIGLPGAHQRLNAALASALCTEWADQQRSKGIAVEVSQDSIAVGLKNARWPGRGQRFVGEDYPSLTWYLDGAHTRESMQVCADWFKEEMDGLERREPRALIFNCTNGRDGLVLLKSLSDLHKSTVPFSHVVFCSNDIYAEAEKQTTDTMNYTVSKDPDLSVQKQLAAAWETLCGASESSTSQPTVEVLPTIQEAVESIANRFRGNSEGRGRVLVTGSLYLVGGVLRVLKAEVS
ncbi:Folylpolyglutamate synthetase [Borealophlyctis nickersoniae]|nr:Folylpolyglutamate synthetase [Borealophlyctis nickersoniae]